MTTFLSGCIALDAAGDVVDAGASVVSTSGDLVTSPFDSNDANVGNKPR